MTTIVYHDNILAADSLTTRREPMSDYTCKHCGEVGALVKENTNKIKLVTGTGMFKGDKIIAVAGAGGVDSIRKFISVLNTVPDLYNALELYYIMVPPQNWAHCCLLMVSDKSVYIVVLDEPIKKQDGSYTVKLETYSRTDTVSIGTGSKVADAAIRIYGEDIFAAISAAATIDDASGGKNINYVDLSAEQKKVASKDLVLRELIKPPVRKVRGRRVTKVTK